MRFGPGLGVSVWRGEQFEELEQGPTAGMSEAARLMSLVGSAERFGRARRRRVSARRGPARLDTA
jgi:hypothetical protein